MFADMSGARLCLPPGTAVLFQCRLGCSEGACARPECDDEPRTSTPTPERPGLASLPDSFCFLAEAAVAESLQHLESKVVFIINNAFRKSGILWESTRFSGESHSTSLLNTTRNKENINFLSK